MRHFAALLLVAACSRPRLAPPADPGATTDPGIAVGNLQGDLETGEALLKKRRSAALMAQLASLYLMHGQLLGRIADYQRAEELAVAAVGLAPRDPRAWSARAQVHARLHQFAAALDALARAEKLGADDVEQQRASVLQATGHYREARPLREKWARGFPRLETLGALATLDADEGRNAEAERHFAEARQHLREL
jgi:tetratricopeptide (TPR) repeat protein